MVPRSAVSLMPVTCKQINDAFLQRHGDTLVINGVNSTNVSLHQPMSPKLICNVFYSKYSILWIMTRLSLWVIWLEYPRFLERAFFLFMTAPGNWMVSFGSHNLILLSICFFDFKAFVIIILNVHKSILKQAGSMSWNNVWFSSDKVVRSSHIKTCSQYYW